MQTCVVCGAPLKGEFSGIGTLGGKGDCCQVIVVVISHNPGCRTAWARTWT
jgi:hypothetical protein